MSLQKEDDTALLVDLAGSELQDHHDRPTGFSGFRWRTRRFIDSLYMRLLCMALVLVDLIVFLVRMSHAKWKFNSDEPEAPGAEAVSIFLIAYFLVDLFVRIFAHGCGALSLLRHASVIPGCGSLSTPLSPAGYVVMTCRAPPPCCSCGRVDSLQASVVSRCLEHL